MRAHMRYALALALLLSTSLVAQTPRAFTAADYARAERFLSYNTTPLVLHSAGRATWLPDDTFWYRTTTEQGEEAILVDAGRAARSKCTLPACERRESADTEGGGRGASQRRDVPSPDGKRTAFVRDWNLWVRD